LKLREEVTVAAKNAPSNDDVSFSVVTYNVNMAFGRKANCAATEHVLSCVKRALKQVFREECFCVFVLFKFFFMLRQNADVFVFQEVHESWIVLLDKVLLSSHPFKCIQCCHNDAGGCAVYSRFLAEHLLAIQPAVEGENKKHEKTLFIYLFIFSKLGSVFPAHLYRVEICGAEFFLVNVHLRPPIEFGTGASLFSMVR
jgi:hypothetical protein